MGGQQTERSTSTGSQESAVSTPAQQQGEQQQYLEPGSMDEKSTKKVVEELNKAMERANSNLEFKYHKEVNMMSVAVVDKSSGKVIKELPPEEMVNNMIKSKIWIGAFLDKIA
ncbi:MAG: flagellar protein FlaG [Selenomonadaceae bacterium]|nr:flagellar protein FlaG [Selenomonadaceae bacterium]